MFGRESPELVALEKAGSPSQISWRRVFAICDFESRNPPSALVRILFGSDQAASAAAGRVNEARKQSVLRRWATV